jgi:hypothetical protein
MIPKNYIIIETKYKNKNKKVKVTVITKYVLQLTFDGMSQINNRSISVRLVLLFSMISLMHCSSHYII